MADVRESINWRADEWFTKYHHTALTKEFKCFWESWSGHQTNYGEDDHEYWVRCAFCLVGWNAGRRYEKYMQTKHYGSLWKDFVDDFCYEKRFHDVLLPSGEIVEQCWPNAGFIIAGDGRQWSGKDAVKVRQSLKPQINEDIEGMSSIRAMFPDAQADEMNFVLFSTSGISGTYNTIEEAEASLKGDTPQDVSFLIVYPRLTSLRYGRCVPKTQDDIDYLKRLRASSHEAVAKIGTEK